MFVQLEEVKRIVANLESQGVDSTWGRVAKVISFMEHGNMTLEGACRLVVNEVVEQIREFQV